MIIKNKIIKVNKNLQNEIKEYFSNEATCGLFIDLNSDFVDKCREEFERECLSYYDDCTFAFYYENFNLKLINEFFNKIEEKLNIKPNNRTKFYNTNDKDIFSFKPAKYWLNNEIAKSFLTLFLRCATVYYDGNFEKALNKYKLTKSILPTIKRLLTGYSKFNYKVKIPPILKKLDFCDYDSSEAFDCNFTGCVDLFKGMSNKDIEISLIKNN